MAIFGYFIWLVICISVTISSVGIVIVSKAFDSTDGIKWVMLFLSLVCCSLWYGAYVWFPFEVIVR